MIIVPGLATAVAGAAGGEEHTTGITPTRRLPELHVAAQDTPFISPIAATDFTCDHLSESSGYCSIEWTQIYAAASTGQYLTRMTIAVAGRIRVAAWGFFQDQMFVPSEMLGSSLRVPCGRRGEGGYADLGASYLVAVVAQETGGGNATAGVIVSCPYAVNIFFDGFETNGTSAWSARYP